MADWQERAKAHGATPVPMRFVTELPDGGRVEPTDPEIVAMGDVFAFRQITYTHDGDHERPACTAVFEVRNGVPVCASFTLQSDSQQGVRTKDFTSVRLDDLRQDVFAYGGVFAPNPDGGYVRVFRAAGDQHNRAGVRRASNRRRITPDVLARVAEIYSSAPERGRTRAVQSELNCQERQAFRYIRAARDAGLIND